MRMGRWSEEESWDTVHVERRASSGEANEMSGEVCWVLGLKGLRVGVSVSFSMFSPSKSCVMTLARGSVCCVVSQVGSCALKSPGYKLTGEC